MKCRRGLTLIELLTVVGILVVLASIVLPAVQSARESMRRTQCTSNLHQIGIAATGFHQRHKRLPTSRVYYDLAADLELQTSFSDLHGFDIVFQKSLIMQCPSDPNSEVDVGASYWMNYGSRIDPENSETRPRPNGVLPPRDRVNPKGVSLESVTDGLSNTSLFSEHLVFVQKSTGHNWWKGSERSPFSPGNESKLREYLSNHAHTLPFAHYSIADTTYHGHFWIDHLWGVNNPLVLFYCCEQFVHPPSSAHRGGVNLLKCDGSVSFISNEIDQEVFSALGTRDGAEVGVVD